MLSIMVQAESPTEGVQLWLVPWDIGAHIKASHWSKDIPHISLKSPIVILTMISVVCLTILCRRGGSRAYHRFRRWVNVQGYAGDEKKLMIGYGDTVWVRVWIMLSYCFCTLCLSGLGLVLGMGFILGKNFSARGYCTFQGYGWRGPEGFWAKLIIS